MPIERLLRAEQQALRSQDPNPRFADPLTTSAPAAAHGPYLEVRSVATGIATLYERLRNTLDFRDEHLIRLYAIRRMLKRRLVRGAQAEKVALPLLQELIRAGYIAQTAVPEAAISQYEKLLLKYIQLFYFLVQEYGSAVNGKLWDRVFTMAASELEETLVPMPQRHTLFHRLIESVDDEGVLQRWPLQSTEKEQQVTIAVYRMMLKLNNELLTWPLFKLQFPKWTHEPSVEDVRAVAVQLPTSLQDYEKAVRHPASDRLSRAIKPVTTTLWLTEQALEEESDRSYVLEHPEQLTTTLNDTIQKHYKAARQRLRRTLWRSLTYILITKMALALLIEVPADRYLTGSVNIINLSFNILAPILFLLIFGLSVRVPGKKNTDQILANAERLVYEGKLGMDQLRAPARARVLLSRLFNFFYSIMYLVTFGGIVLLLMRFHFTPVGIFLFLFFLSIVSFFGFRIREQAQELIVTRGQDGFLVFLFVLFFLPILQIGRWISQQSSKINVFLYFFDLFIEAPLQSFLEFFDQFTGFIREKREDITS